MNRPTVIDVAIGLVLVFFLLSTLGSVLAELWAAHQKWRHQLLRATVTRLLEREFARKFWSHPLLLPLYDRAPRPAPETGDTEAPEAAPAAPGAAAGRPGRNGATVPGAAAGVPGQVHDDFANALRPVAARLDALVAQLKDRRVLFHVTGHSLGAALATLAALRFGRQPQTACPIHTVHTFGSPRVGDAAFVQAFDRLFQGRSYRFVNDEDLVTCVPTRAQKYDHGSDIIYIDESGHLQRDIGYWYRFLNFTTNALDDLKRAVQTTVKDHSMKLYCGHLEKAARTPTVI